jgi:ABC-2 type transport system permease protein
MRYLRLLAIFYKNALLTELEYRVNFLINLVMSAFWLAWSIIGTAIFFQHTDRIGGWSYYEVLVVLGLFFLMSGIMSAVLRPNIDRLVESIRLGTLDFVLTKPVNSQFLASLRYLVIWRLVDVVMGLGIIVYALQRLGARVSAGQVLLFVGLVVAATVIVYSIWLALVTLAFWFVRVDNIAELFSSFYEAARFPVSAFPRWARGLLTFVVPIAFITTVPAAAVVGRLEPPYAVYALLLAVGLFTGATLFWRYALRHYTSASS